MVGGKITNTGPIKELPLVLDAPGVWVLKGRNGRGKTTALDAVSAALGAKRKLTNRDRTARGEVEFAGVRLSITPSRTKHFGELECESIEGRLDISDFVHPGIQQPDRADAKRIKTLVQLVGVKPDRTAFYELLGGKEAFDKVVPASIDDTDDLVVMAERVKRALDAAALREEELSATDLANARAAKEAAEGVDLQAEDDEAALRAAVEAAVGQKSKLATERAGALEVARLAAQAREGLAKAEASYTGPTREEADADLTLAQQAQVAANEKVDQLKDLLRAAEARAAQAKAHVELKRQALAAAVGHLDLLEAFRQSIEAAEKSGQKCPTEGQLAMAADAVDQANRALELGALVRQAKKGLFKATQYEVTAEAHRAAGERYRQAGKGTDDVLSKAVAEACPELRVDGGRLVTTTEERGETLVHELSDGEAWRLGIRIGAKAGGPRAIIVAKQQAWQDLDPIHRQEVHEYLASLGSRLLTAKATAGELRAEHYDPIFDPDAQDTGEVEEDGAQTTLIMLLPQDTGEEDGAKGG